MFLVPVCVSAADVNALSEGERNGEGPEEQAEQNGGDAAA
jgi:hypothetical protein